MSCFHVLKVHVVRMVICSWIDVLHSCYRTVLSNNTMSVLLCGKLHVLLFRWLPALLRIFHNFPSFCCGQMLLFNPYAGFPSDALLLLFSMRFLPYPFGCCRVVHVDIFKRVLFYCKNQYSHFCTEQMHLLFCISSIYFIMSLRETVAKMIRRYLVLHADLQNNSSRKEISSVVVYFKFTVYDHVCLFWETCSSFRKSSCTIWCTCEAIMRARSWNKICMFLTNRGNEGNLSILPPASKLGIQKEWEIWIINLLNVSGVTPLSHHLICFIPL